MDLQRLGRQMLNEQVLGRTDELNNGTVSQTAVSEDLKPSNENVQFLCQDFKRLRLEIVCR